MLSITDINYNQYKKVLGVISTFLIPPNAPEAIRNADPIAVLDRWEKQNMDRAKKGLKIGLMDMFSALNDASAEQKADLDKQLREKNLPGLYELLNHAWDIREKVLKKKKIRNLDEYYVIVEELSRVDSDLDDEQRKILGEAVLQFEKNKSKKKS
jgi:hypothetical protein